MSLFYEFPGKAGLFTSILEPMNETIIYLDIFRGDRTVDKAALIVNFP